MMKHSLYEQIQESRNKETVHWMNSIVQKSWSQASALVADIIVEKSRQAIQEKFAKSKPPAIVCTTKKSWQCSGVVELTFYSDR